MASIERIKYLLQKVTDDSATQKDIDELLEWIDSSEGLNHAMWICEQLDISPVLIFERLNAREMKTSPIVDRILEMGKEHEQVYQLPVEEQFPKVRKIQKWKKIASVAAVICVVGSISFLADRSGFFHRKSKNQQVAVNHSATQILPGSTKAILTLNNGKQIVLDSNAVGVIANEGNAKVEKQDNGQLAYIAAKNTVSKEILYNTLSTPRGGQYKVLLPDGTKAWLNAASEITYPTAFSGNRREVSIKGEVYFEVTHNAAKPFIVKTDKNMQVQVLGTHFDVNAYPDEDVIKTTLLEGSVKVTSASDVKMLKPGEQMQLATNGSLQLVKDADIESIMGWKEGVFNFNQADISSVMRQLSRWYDIDVVYNSSMPKDLFSAIISRGNSIDQVLTMLQTTLRVHFNIQNRTIYVSS